MGMDVYGTQPTSKTGEYFRNNVWWWRPLADYVRQIAPEITAACVYWQSNDGDGLDAAGARALADRLQQELSEGRTAAYAAIRAAELAALPDEPCAYCASTGTRTDAVGVRMGMRTRTCPDEPGHPRRGEVGWCNGCDGRGRVRPSEADYPFSVENVEAFVAFLRDCGGFEIH